MADSRKIVSEAEKVLTALRKSADGLTTMEICEKEGISDTKARQLLLALKKAGRLKVGKKPVAGLNDVIYMRDCYQVVEPGKRRL